MIIKLEVFIEQNVKHIKSHMVGLFGTRNVLVPTKVVITSSSHSSALLSESTGIMEDTRFILDYFCGKSY